MTEPEDAGKRFMDALEEEFAHWKFEYIGNGTWKHDNLVFYEDPAFMRMVG